MTRYKLLLFCSLGLLLAAGPARAGEPARLGFLLTCEKVDPRPEGGDETCGLTQCDDHQMRWYCETSARRTMLSASDRLLEASESRFALELRDGSNRPVRLRALRGERPENGFARWRLMRTSLGEDGSVTRDRFRCVSQSLPPAYTLPRCELGVGR